MTLPDSPHRFSNEFGKAVLKALGLEGQRVRRIEITMDVLEPVTAKVFLYSTLDRSMEFTKVLEMGEWHQEVTSADDPIKTYAT